MIKRFLHLLVLLGGVFSCSAQVDWPHLEYSMVATNLASPVGITHAGDGSGRLFIVEQQGTIRIVAGTNLLSNPFLDVRDRVVTGSERGLLCVAFPPGYATNGHFYVNYTRKPDGATVISRFLLTTNSSVADTNSEQILKVIPQPFVNHNGGQLAFGPDGYLYIGMGDGGYGSNGIGDPSTNAQNKLSLLGKILRIDVESGVVPYAIPASNPFYGNTNYAPEIWALGLRNPWRFSFDRLTGDLFIADVGHGAYEEVNFQPASWPGGANYGWRMQEGFQPYRPVTNFDLSTLTAPILSYSHLSNGLDLSASITGGFVYRGPDEPRMNGVYFFSDFISGQLWALKYANSNWQQLEVVKQVLSFSTNFQVSTFGEDEQGSQYLADYRRGRIYQLHDSHKVWPPVFSPTNGTINVNYATVTCLTTNAILHYTTNGIDPTELDPAVASGGTIPVSNGVLNKLRAFRADLTPSAVTTATFTFKTGTPIFNPPAGAIVSNTVMTISTVTSNATIYFTTNGVTPTTSSPVYNGPLTVNGGITLRAFAVAAGYSNSAIATASYPAAQVSPLVFTPAAGPVTNGATVSISCATPSSAIYYTLNGTTPTTNAIRYSAPFTINGNTTVQAQAYASNYVASAIKSVFYDLVKVATPTFNPTAGPITNGTAITISTTTAGASLFYTLDGSDPTTNSFPYTSPIAIQGDTTVIARGFLDQFDPSLPRNVFFNRVQVAAPSFSPPNGPVGYGTLISMADSTPGSTIYYTLDGSTPTTNSLLYNGPVGIYSNLTLSAKAIRPEYNDSAVTSVYFSLLTVATPVFSPNSGRVTNQTPVTITTATAGADIYYTLDNTTPTTNSIPYDGPFLFDGNLTISAFATKPYFNDSSVATVYLPLIVREKTVVTTIAGTGVAGYTNGPGLRAQFTTPYGVCVGGGNLYVADSGNNLIRKISLSGNFATTTLAGSGIAGSVNGQGTNAQFSTPIGICVGPGNNLFVSDRGNTEHIRKVTPQGFVSNFAVWSGPGNGWSLWQIDVDPAGNCYVGEWAAVWKVDTFGNVSQFAGPGSCCPNGWGQTVGLCVDSIGTVYATTYEYAPARVVKISSAGVEETYAGGGQAVQDGPRLQAGFAGPSDSAIDSAGNVFISDGVWIRKISTNGTVSTLAGDGTAGFLNGRGDQARFNGLTGLCVETNGNIYITDSANHCIRRISADLDLDGIPDFEEVAGSGYTKGVDDTYIDSDGDGRSNAQEYIAGTNPLSASSRFELKSAALSTNGVTLSWDGALNRAYAVSYSSNLTSWTVATNLLSVSNALVSVTLTSSPATNAFYRLSVSLP
jgi:hypothetical protein